MLFCNLKSFYEHISFKKQHGCMFSIALFVKTVSILFVLNQYCNGEIKILIAKSLPMFSFLCGDYFSLFTLVICICTSLSPLMPSHSIPMSLQYKWMKLTYMPSKGYSIFLKYTFLIIKVVHAYCRILGKFGKIIKIF